jgi:hypothetical protein
MNGPVGAVALQNQDGRSLMEIGIVLNDHGTRGARNNVGKQYIIRSKFL